MCPRPQEIEIVIETLAGGATTDYSVRSGVIALAGGEVEASLSGSASVEDLGDDRATLVGRGDFSGIGLAQAVYQRVGTGDALFSHLIGVLRVGSGGTASVSQSDPADGSYRFMAANVVGVFARTAFALTAGDRGRARATFEIHEISACQADVNGDGLVDVQDLLVVLLLYGTVEGGGGYDADIDFDADGEIGLGDLVILLGDYGQPC